MPVLPPARPAFRWRPWLVSGAVLAGCTAVSAALEPFFDHANIILVYMAGMIYVAQREGRAAALSVVAGSILIFDCIFVAPRWSFTPIDPQYYFTFLVMAAVGWLVSQLAETARREAGAAAEATVAVELERLRSTLLSGISHDFRTPLTTIVGSATSLLQQGHALDEAHRRALLEGLLGEAQRLHALSNNLLELTRMQQGAVQPQSEWFPADELAEEACQAVAARLEGRLLEVSITPPEAVVWGDPRLLCQALVNLLENVARHTPAGTAARIDIGIEPGGRHWWLAVQDQGPGLPPSTVAGASHQQQHPSGLGLAICAAVARLHAGELQATSRQGARLALRLPQPAGGTAPEREPT